MLELKTLVPGRGPLKGLFCSCPSTGCCQGHMTLPALLLVLWVPFKGGLELQSADTAPPFPGLGDQLPNGRGL